MWNTLEAFHASRSHTAKRSILCSSNTHGSSCGFCCMRDTGQDIRATQQKQTAYVMLDQQLKTKAAAHCPSHRDFKPTLVAMEAPATTPCWVPHHDHQTQEAEEAHRWVEPLGHASTAKTETAPKAAALIGKASNAVKRVQNHNRFYNASTLQRTSELGGSVVDANSSGCPLCIW